MRAHTLPWLPLLLLGAAHGLNPAMGWLFAVGRGLQRRDRRALWCALGPLAAGHALAIAGALTLARTLGWVLPTGWLRWVVAAALLVVGVDGLVRHRHVRLGGMNVGARELAVWSCVMASAHGAGLMVLPFLAGAGAAPTAALHAHHAHAAGGHQAASLAAGLPGVDETWLLVPVIHTLGYLAVTAALAVVVYEKLGLRVLRRAWVNVDAVWAGALVLAAAATLLA